MKNIFKDAVNSIINFVDNQNMPTLSKLKKSFIALFGLGGASFAIPAIRNSTTSEPLKHVLSAAVELFRISYLTPNPDQLVMWFYRSPHYNIELRESVINLLAAHFDTFASFKRRTVDAWTVLVDPGLPATPAWRAMT